VSCKTYRPTSHSHWEDEHLMHPADRCGRSASDLRSCPRPILAASQLTEAGSMRVQLTKRQGETYQPRERSYEVRDAQVRGLVSRVQPSGNKAWIASWAHGKRRTIGPTTTIPLDLARSQATHATHAIVSKITDGRTGGRATRIMTSDGLDRLKTATSTMLAALPTPTTCWTT